jgi:hypothetical protein
MPKPQLTKKVMQQYEESARALRARAGIGPYEPFDPLALAPQLGVLLKYPDEAGILPAELLAEIGELNAKEWSGISRELPTGKLFVILNRNQTLERARVTLLEEVAHQYHGHTPVCIGTGGRAQYIAEEEQEAKFTAAAALLPSREIAKAVYQSVAATYIARSFGASVELVEMRIKTLNLWEHYRLQELTEAA